MSRLQDCCMVMKINLDCNACCRKMKRIILRMKEIERYSIEKQHLRVIVCGRFIPADVAIKIRKKMHRRVEILEIQEFGNVPIPNPNENVEQQQEQQHEPGSQQHGPRDPAGMGMGMGMPMGMAPPHYSHFPEHHYHHAIAQHA